MGWYICVHNIGFYKNKYWPHSSASYSGAKWKMLTEMVAFQLNDSRMTGTYYINKFINKLVKGFTFSPLYCIISSVEYRVNLKPFYLVFVFDYILT